ncbi:MAG: M48 family peptidase [Xanthomonadales bacterium]|nr:M48 family peptidase [Xanthomonadales bacterium]
MLKFSRHNITRCTVALATLVVSLASVAQTERVSLPDMGASADTIISRKEEEDYARALLRQMRAYEVLNEDPLVAGYFQDMGYRLVANSDRPNKSFTFAVVDLPVVNAFAAPGGVVVLYSGLILAADNESEVAAVLSHEIAHITQQHMERAIESAKSMTIPLLLAMVGLVLAGGGSGEAIQGALMGGSAAAQQAQIYFTRQNEIEADRIGMQTLYQAGYDPRGMGEFFEKLGRITRPMGEGPPEFLRTHPVTVSRIAEADNRAQNLPSPAPSDGRDFYLIQARIRALAEAHPEKALEYFRFRSERADITETQQEALDYGIAIALQRKGEFGESREILNSLMSRAPHLAFELQIAALDLESGKISAAVERLAGLYQSFPGNHAISIAYCDALLRDSKPGSAETASTILRQQLLTHPDDPTLFVLYAGASNNAGNAVRAKEAIAESYYQRGSTQEAITQLQALVNSEDLDYYERARISARLNELQIELVKLDIEDEPPPE